MTKVFLSVFDHSEERGYHFRKAQRQDWEAAVRLENQAIRMLSDEHREARIRLLPLSDGAYALMRSTSFNSDQRSALKTVSLLVQNPVGPPRWQIGLLDLLEKALTTNSEGGEMNFDLEEARHTSAEHLTPMFEASLTGTYRIEMQDLDHVFSTWSLLPPDKRRMTEIVVGSVDEDESIANGMNLRLVVEPTAPSDRNGNHLLLPEHVNLPRDEEGLDALHRSALLADSTGFDGQRWLATVASEMDRRGYPIQADYHLNIRMALTLFDRDTNRREGWRTLALTSARFALKSHFPVFFETLGMLTSAEWASLNQQERRTVLMHHAEKLADPTVSNVNLEALTAAIPSVDDASWCWFIACSDLSVWLTEHLAEMIWVFLTKLLQHSKSFFSDEGALFCGALIERIAQSSATDNTVPLQHRLIEALEKTHVQVGATGGSMTNLLKMQTTHQTTTMLGGKKASGVLLHTSPEALAKIQWSDPAAMIEECCELNAAIGTDANVEMIHRFVEAIASQNERTAYIKSLFKSYLNALEVQFRNSDVNIEPSLLQEVAQYAPTRSWWFEELFRTSPDEVDHVGILEIKNLSLQDVPDSVLNHLYHQRPRMKGWPNPFKRVDEAMLMRTSIGLALQPSLVQRGFKLLGRGCLLSILAYIVLAMYAGATMITSVPFEGPFENIIAEPHFRLITGIHCFVSLSLILLWRSKIKTFYPR